MKSVTFCKGFLLSLSNKSYALKNSLRFSSLVFAVLFLGLFFGFSGKASAANYSGTVYVTQNAQGLGDGSSYANSISIATHNASTFSAGATIYLCDTITTALTVPSSGNVSNVIIYRGDYSGHPGIIDGANVISINFTVASKSYITVTNLTSINSTVVNFYASGTSNHIIFDTCTSIGSQYGFDIAVTTPAGTPAVDIINGTVTKATNSGIAFIAGDNRIMGGVIGNSLADGCSKGISIGTGESGYTLSISDVSASYSYGPVGNGSNLYAANVNASSVIISNSDFSYAQLDNNVTLIGSNNLTFNYVNFHHAVGTNNLYANGVNVTSNATSGSSNIAFNHCAAYNNNNDGFSSTQNTTALHDITYNYCTSYNNGTLGDLNMGDGFTTHANAYNIFVNYCIAYNNTLTGYAFVNTSSGTIKNSIAFENGGSTGTRAGFFINDTDVNSVTGTTWAVSNSIGYKNYPVEIYIYDGTKGTTFDYNNYLPINTNSFAKINTTTYTQAQWRALTGPSYDSHSVFADPQFASIITPDFHLQNTSLVINAGTDVGLTTDYEGNPKSGPNFDIGAYEFQDSTAPTTSNNITAGTYNSVQSMTLTCDDGVGVGCDKTYYTLDGTDPTTSSTQYTGAISTPDNATTVFKYFSRDRNENSETIKSRTYVIDTIVPNTTIDSNPDTLINTNSATFTFSASETATFQCKLDSGAYASCSTPKNYTNLAEGAHIFYVKAIDVAANDDATPASYSFTVDTGMPTISDLVPNNTILSVTTTNINLTLTTSETTTCKYSTASGTNYALMTAFDSTNNTTHSTNISSLNSGTTYNYYIKCKDAINESTEEHLTFSIAPEENETSLNSIKIKIERETNKFKDKIYSWKNKFKLKGDDENLANGQVKIYKNNKLWKTIEVGANGIWSKILKFKDNFSGNLKINQYDQYGTLLSKQKEKIKVDTEKPEIFTASPLYIKHRGSILAWTGKDNDQISYYKVVIANRIIKTKQPQFIIPNYAPKGAQTITISAYDRAGNKTSVQVRLVVSW